jgi:hypothetical protein
MQNFYTYWVNVPRLWLVRICVMFCSQFLRISGYIWERKEVVSQTLCFDNGKSLPEFTQYYTPTNALIIYYILVQLFYTKTLKMLLHNSILRSSSDSTYCSLLSCMLKLWICRYIYQWLGSISCVCVCVVFSAGGVTLARNNTCSLRMI